MNIKAVSGKQPKPTPTQYKQLPLIKELNRPAVRETADKG